MLRVIGIDPGTNCGWAVLTSTGDRDASGVWGLKPGRHQGGGMRFVKLRSHLNELYAAYNSGDGTLILGYEEVRRHKGTDAAHIYGGVVAVVSSFCEENNVPYQAIPVGTIKKLATGKGNAGKELVLEAAQKQWRVDLTRSDEADALWVAECLRQDLHLG